MIYYLNEEETENVSQVTETDVVNSITTITPKPFLHTYFKTNPLSIDSRNFKKLIQSRLFGRFVYISGDSANPFEDCKFKVSGTNNLIVLPSDMAEIQYYLLASPGGRESDVLTGGSSVPVKYFIFEFQGFVNKESEIVGIELVYEQVMQDKLR